MIESGQYEVILFNQIVTLEVDVIPADETGREAYTWEILSIKDSDTYRDCFDGLLMEKIEEHIYHLGVVQILSGY